MIITSSALSLDAQHERHTLSQEHESVRFSSGRAADRQSRGATVLAGRNSVQVDISVEAHARMMQTAVQQTTPSSGANGIVQADPDAASAEPRMLVLARMIEALTGVRVRIISAADLSDNSAQQPTSAPTPDIGAQQGGGWSLSYDRISIQTESETLVFNAQGVVRTDDGRTITLQTSLQLQRSVTSVQQFSLRLGEAARPVKDPLVLHFDGALPELLDTRFTFDLDADGQTEAIPFVGQGSGVLVLDRNGNGQIDDGRELFGALSGDGFADLARLDSDGSGWIDAADPVFERLQVWQKDAAGTDHYRTLKELGVGALSLARTGSPFSLQGSGGSVLGQIRSSGVYLTENGQPGLMQQIDLVV